MSEYLRLLNSRDSEACAEILTLPSANAELRALCTDYVARQLETGDPLRLDQEATHWLSKNIRQANQAWLVVACARAWQHWAPLSGPFTQRVHWRSCLNTPWLRLSEADWDVLMLYPNANVREAAKFLKSHPFIAFEAGSAPPADPRARQLWLVARLAHALDEATEENSTRLNETYQYLAEHPDDYPFAVESRGETSFYVPSEIEVPQACTDNFLSWTAALSKSENAKLRQMGYTLLSLQMDAAMNAPSAMAKRAVRQLMDRLKEDCSQIDEQAKWRARNKWLLILENAGELKGKNLELAESWTRELASALIKNPRKLLAGREFAECMSGRAADLLSGLLDGRCHFLPDDEWDSKSKPETDSPEELFTRMKAALAKLD